MDVEIAVCTFGGNEWRELADRRAVPSAEAQGVPVRRCHADTLAESRNYALELCETEFLIYLDADDELEPGYCEAMLAGQGDVRAPAVRRIVTTSSGRPRVKRSTYMPRVWGHRHQCVGDCLKEGNWITVGAMARVDLLREVGGWDGFPVYEDWALWLKCWKAGGDIQPCPDAVYRYWESPNSRNGSLPPRERDEWHYRIVESVMGAPA